MATEFISDTTRRGGYFLSNYAGAILGRFAVIHCESQLSNFVGNNFARALPAAPFSPMNIKAHRPSRRGGGGGLFRRLTRSSTGSQKPVTNLKRCCYAGLPLFLDSRMIDGKSGSPLPSSLLPPTVNRVTCAM